MTPLGAMAYLRRWVDNHGSQQAAAKALDVSPQYLSDALADYLEADA